MKIPYQLRWLPTSAPATALLVSGHRVENVLRVCVELGADPLPLIYAAADGFLVKLPAPSEKRMAGVIRLSGLSQNLFVPVNAELIPPLLPDETTSLARKRGLIFLPGVRVLEYDPDQPLAPEALSRIEFVRRRPWRAFPTPPVLADSVTEITLFAVDPSAEQILEPGGDGIGTDNTKLPDAGNLPSQVLGNALFQLGKGMAWLGQAMNAAPLAGLGAKLLGGAMSLIPSLSEKLMGEQEAKLRDLLRKFREGNIEDALKHALPLGGDSARGSAPAQNAQLPTHSLFYSLLNLLGSSGQEGGSMWFTPDNTFYELQQEYRRQAELARQRGDFRRAAFIHARLLNDYHSAAKVLSQGGLHRDAAVLYEQKLHDPTSAAREWEAAGEFDRALHLYRKQGDHIAAGDLLRRIGEEDRAVKEYQIAAAKLLEHGPQHYEAGELLRVRAERPDLAQDYYARGWGLRPMGNALSCATRLVQLHATGGKADLLLTVLSEAEPFLVERGPEQAGHFYTEVARLAQTPALEPIAAELRDRALLGIAKKMRQCLSTTGSSAGALPNLLKNPSVWPVPLVGDAQYAVSQMSKRPAPAKPAYSTVQAGRSRVTAVCQMPMSGQVFLGLEDGEVLAFEPPTGAVHLLTRQSGPILSLVLDASKTYLLILSEMGPDKVCLRVVSREIGYRMIDYYWLDVTAPARLAIPALNSKTSLAVLCHGSEYRLFTLPSLVTSSSAPFLERDDIPEVVAYGTLKSSILWTLAIYNGRADLLSGEGPHQKTQSASLDWCPGVGEDSTLKQAQLRVVMLGDHTVEILGLDTRGSLRRTRLRLHDGKVDTATFHPIGSERYRACAWLNENLLAGVHMQGIVWWAPSRVRPVQTKLINLRDGGGPIAAFPLPEMRELLIVAADGLLTRVPIAE